MYFLLPEIVTVFSSTIVLLPDDNKLGSGRVEVLVLTGDGKARKWAPIMDTNVAVKAKNHVVTLDFPGTTDSGLPA